MACLLPLQSWQQQQPHHHYLVCWCYSILGKLESMWPISIDHQSMEIWRICIIRRKICQHYLHFGCNCVHNLYTICINKQWIYCLGIIVNGILNTAFSSPSNVTRHEWFRAPESMVYKINSSCNGKTTRVADRCQFQPFAWEKRFWWNICCFCCYSFCSRKRRNKIKTVGGIMITYVVVCFLHFKHWFVSLV